MTPQQQQIVDRVKHCVQIGNQLFSMNMPVPHIRFDLKGRAAGRACYRNGQLLVRFNHDMLTREAFDHVIKETVPHEIAHSFCQYNPRLGRNHDRGWNHVCRRLGGIGERCHNEEVVHGKGTTYEYITDRGHKVRLGDKYHRRVQSGDSLRYRKGLGTVTKNCAYSIVGYQGRTLATPIVKVPAANMPVVAPVVPTVPVAPVVPVVRPVVAPVAVAGESKAAVSRRIMLSGYQAGHSYETIIQAMIAANGYDRQLARATFKANAPKVGIPTTFC